MSNVVYVNDASFEVEVLNSDIPVLVDFWAEWCGPCRSLSPILDELAVHYAAKVKIVKINVDESPEVAGRYGVRGIPTLLLFKNGELLGSKVGALPKVQLITFVDSSL